MRRKGGGNSWGSLKQPVDIGKYEVNLLPKGIPVSSVQVILHYYNRVHDQYKFKYNTSDSQWISLETVITHVRLTYNSETQIYTLESTDAAILNDYVSNNSV